MKKLFVIVLGVAALGFSLTAHAQTHRNDSTAGQHIKKDAQKVGDKTSEVAAKGAAKVTDKVYADKVGPNGQTIYIDKHSRYYWIDNKGRKNYVEHSALKDKKDNQ